MSDQTPFEARLADAYARYVAAAPVEVDPRMVAATVATGSAGRPLGWPNVITPGRLVGVLVAVGLVALLLSAAAILVGSRLIEHPPIRGLLAYELDGDIFLADQDGAHPRKVADGVPRTDAGGGPSYLFGDGGPAWAPDGRHFLFYDVQGAAATQQLTGHIADASGHVVASIPNIWVDATWSPDSTRIEGWTGGSAWIGTTQISIFGVDGVLQTSLALPEGYLRARESPGFWAADGRSVYVHIDPGGGPAGPVWQLPVDGSAPRRLAQDDLITRSGGDLSFSPDGSRMVANDGDSLVVANADGTDLRALGPAGMDRPLWSPTGTQVAYLSSVDAGTQTADIRVVDIASGVVRTVVTGLQVNGPGLLGWSPDGDRILFAGLDQQGSTLWSINADGTDRKVLVPGATGGEWEPVPLGR